MTTVKTPAYVEIASDGVAQALDVARENLESGDELTLDFSRVPRIEARDLRALEALAKTGEEKGANISLRGVNVEVYKVLKLARLTSRFSFER